MTKNRIRYRVMTLSKAIDQDEKSNYLNLYYNCIGW